MILLKLNFNIILIFAGHLQTLLFGSLQNLIYETGLDSIQLLLEELEALPKFILQ